MSNLKTVKNFRTHLVFIYTLHDADFVPAVTAYICIRWDTSDEKTSIFLWERAMPILLTLKTFYIGGVEVSLECTFSETKIELT